MLIDMEIDIVIPCFNEQEVLPEFFSKLKQTISNHENYNWNLIFINDGSIDKTESIINSWTPNGNIKTINQIVLAKNHGHMVALREGYKNSNGDLIITLDCDLQDPPEIITELLNKYLEDPDSIDCVNGQRKERKFDSWFKRNTAKLYYFLINLLVDRSITPEIADLRLVTRNLKSKLLEYKGNYPIYRVLIPLTTKNIEIVTFERQNRFAGKSKYDFRSMFKLATLTFFNFTDKPLRFLQRVFQIQIFFIILTFIFILYSYVTNNIVEGWSSMLGIMMIMYVGIMSILFYVSKYIYLNYLHSQGIPLVMSKKKVN